MPSVERAHGCIGFDGTETGGRAPNEQQAKQLEGPTHVLEDAEPLCAFARFCDPHGQVWNLVHKPGAEAAKLVEHEAGHCPGGRLVTKIRTTGRAVEPHFDPSRGLIQETAKQISGPIWARGGIPVLGADDSETEVPTRVALCRCGDAINEHVCARSHESTQSHHLP